MLFSKRGIQNPSFGPVCTHGNGLLEFLLTLRRACWPACSGGAEGAEAFGARNGVPGELLVRLRVEKVIAMRDIAD